MEHFKRILRAQGLMDIRRQKIKEWEARVHERGTTVDDVADLEIKAPQNSNYWYPEGHCWWVHLQ